VLDVLQVPAFGKKGRMVAHVQILAEPAAADAVREACFNETTTLGVRAQVVERCVLPRQHAAVTVGEQTLRVKVAQRPGAVATAKVESDDLRTLQGGSAARARARRKAEEEGLKDG
jgi:uncharacterized protein (DUF111 family)